MSGEEHVLTIEFGSNSVRALIGVRASNDRLGVRAQSEWNYAQPLRESASPEETLGKALRSVLDRLQAGKNLRFTEAFVALPSSDATSRIGRGHTSVAARTVSADDLRVAIENAQMDARVVGEEVVACRVLSTAVDGRRVERAIDQVGNTLDVEIAYVSCSMRTLALFDEALKYAGLQSAGYLLDIVAEGSALLSTQEQHDGVALVDIGETKTTIGVWSGGGFYRCLVFASGTRDFAEEVARTYRIPMDAAARLQSHWGCAPAPMASEVKSVGSGDQQRVVPRTGVYDILASRVTEHLFSVLGELKALEPRITSVVLTGGGTGLPGIEDVAVQYFHGQGIHCRVGVPSGIDFGNEYVSQLRSVATVGLFLEAVHRQGRGPFYLNREETRWTRLSREFRRFWEGFF